MSKKKIETCLEHCKYEDCIYKRVIGGGIPVCFYAVVMNESRKCKISECDKYRTGKKRVRSREEYIEWELYYDDVYI